MSTPTAGAAAQTPIDHIPFLKLLGLQQLDAEPGQSRLRLPDLKPEFCNLLPAAHGGVVMTLLDVAMARAATSHPKSTSSSVVTVEMSTRFIKPGRGVLTAEGRVLHTGGSLCTTEAHVRDAGGELVASAMGTFKYWRAPLGGVE
ncbi:MAG: PaaI family thioesterase [Burkholderiales bacterium]|nr:PaaI family thioesterase [Burkholderiales bacterium]